MAVTLDLTEAEAGALDALTQGVGALAGRPVDRDSGMVAALEAGLVRLLEEYDLPQTDRAPLEAALQRLRDAWSRGNACL